MVYSDKKSLTYRLEWLLIIALLFTVLASYAQRLPPGFVQQKLYSLQFPSNFSIAPDGRIFVLEQEGFVRIIENGILLSEPVVQLDSVYSQKEKGLLGITFDPKFEFNKYIYIYYTVNLSGNRVNDILLSGTPVRNKIVRYTLDGNTAVAASKKTILDLDIIPSFLVNFNHDGGTMHFGPDGKLYVAVGENTMWCSTKCHTVFSTNCSCGTTWIPSTASQDMNSFHGKMLRINPDGSAPVDNPYISSPSPVEYAQRYIYALGVRNPYSWQFRPGTLEIYLNDIGSSGGSQREEINMVSPLGNKNLGYPAREGVSGDPQYNDPIFSYTGRICSGSGSARTCLYPATSTTVGCAIAGGLFYTFPGSNWPAEYQGRYFFLDFCNGWINTLDVDNATDVRNFATSLSGNYTNDSGGGNGSLVLDLGQDGQIYHLVRSQTAGVSGIYRISYQPTPITTITLTGPNQIISCGSKITISADLTPSNPSISDVLWSAKPNHIALVVQGEVIPLQNGIVTVTAVSNADYTARAHKIITISGQNIPATSLQIVASKTVLGIGDADLTFTGVFTPSNVCNTQVKWNIESASAGLEAYINSKGILYIQKGSGLVTISGRADSDMSIQHHLVVSVSSPIVSVTGLSLQSAIQQLTIGGATFLDVLVEPFNADDKSIAWSVSPSNIIEYVTSDTRTTVIGKNMGVATITATSIQNASVSSVFVFTVVDQPNDTVTGILNLNNKKDEDLTIYPNPTDEYIFIWTKNDLQIESVQVSDLKGNAKDYPVLISEERRNYIDVWSLTKGAYLIQIKTKDSVFRKLFMKE